MAITTGLVDKLTKHKNIGMEMKCNLATFILGLMFVLVFGYDCPYEECYCYNYDIYCDNENLDAIPNKTSDISLDIRWLYLHDNNITTIPAGSLPGNLSGIDLQNNPIETIDDSAFDESIDTLNGLDFSRARFTQLPNALFRLTNLNSLFIYATNIISWDEDGMKQLSLAMQQMILDNVGLLSWPTWIKPMANLTSLTLTGNQILSIPYDAFELMANSLEYLDISNNSLTSIPKSLSNLTALYSLTLSYNKIIDLTWLPHSKLKSLYLDNNEITDAKQLGVGLRMYASYLTNFEIETNSLTSIPDLSFLKLIASVDFTFNNISNGNSGSFPSAIYDLKFTNNKLTSIPSVLSNLKDIVRLHINKNNILSIQGNYIPTSVRMLDLSFNNISNLTRSSFPTQSSLWDVDLNNNPLVLISADAFINVPLLNGLHLQGSKLTRLPLALGSLIKLGFLDVSDSKDLVCTCEEKSLQSIILILGPFLASGNCDTTSVFDFYKELSPKCP